MKGLGPAKPALNLYKAMQLSDQIELCRRAHGATTDWSAVEPGDIFFAIRSKVPAEGIQRRIWKVLQSLELANPALPGALARLTRWTSWADDFDRLARTQLDGNAYAGRAIAAGASYAFVDNPAVARGPRFILVENAEKRLAQIATELRREVDLPAVAITGSVGKTTTRKLIAAVLSKKYRLAVTSESHNNAPYIASFILSHHASAEALVMEFGGLAPFTITRLCEIAAPTHGVLTRIGIAHLNTYGSVEGIRKGKWELPEYLAASGGHFFQNIDDDWIRQQPLDPGTFTPYGTSGDAAVRGVFLSSDPLLKLRWFPLQGSGTVDIQTRLFGRYNLENALAAIAVGTHFGVPDQAIIEAIEACPPAENRSQMVTRGTNTFILDSGSVTPTSLEAALSNFGSLEAGGKMVVLADMLRLAGYTGEAHRAAIRQVASMGLERAIFVGEHYWRERDERVGIFFRNTPALRRWWQAQRFEHKTVLIKGAIRFRLKEVLGI